MLSIARFSVAIGSAPDFSSTIFERVVHDLLGDGALAVQHHLVDDLGDEQRPVDRVGHQLTALGGSFTRHVSQLSLVRVTWRILAP